MAEVAGAGAQTCGATTAAALTGRWRADTSSSKMSINLQTHRPTDSGVKPPHVGLSWHAPDTHMFEVARVIPAGLQGLSIIVWLGFIYIAGSY